MNLKVPFILQSFLTLMCETQIGIIADILLLSELLLQLLEQSMLLLELDLQLFLFEYHLEGCRFAGNLRRQVSRGLLVVAV